MKFLKDVYCPIGTDIQRFSNRHAPFVFFTFRKDVATSSWISYVAPVEAQMIHFEVFCHMVRKSHFDPKKISFLRKNIYIQHIDWAELFCHIGGLQLSLFINLLQTWLANCWGYLAKFLLALSVFPFISCLQYLHSSMTMLPPNIRIFAIF